MHVTRIIYIFFCRTCNERARHAKMNSQLKLQASVLARMLSCGSIYIYIWFGFPLVAKAVPQSLAWGPELYKRKRGQVESEPLGCPKTTTREVSTVWKQPTTRMHTRTKQAGATKSSWSEGARHEASRMAWRKAQPNREESKRSVCARDATHDMVQMHPIILVAS